MGGGAACVGAVSQHCGKSDTGRCARRRNCMGGAVSAKLWGSYVSFMPLIHSQKCSICYSVACFSECVAEVVFVVQSSQTLLPLSHAHQNRVKPELTRSHGPLNPGSTRVSKVGSTPLTSRVEPGLQGVKVGYEVWKRVTSV